MIIKYLVICFSDGDFYRIGTYDQPNEATDAMKRDVLREMENRGYTETDEEYIGVESGNYGSYNYDVVSIDAISARFKEIDMYWTIMQIDINEESEEKHNDL